jgi:hypothetical protein
MSSDHGEKKLPDDLQDVGDQLRDQRPALEPLELDRIKLRAMSGARRSSSQGRRAFVRSPLMSLLTVVFLIMGTGGALALGGGFKNIGNFGFKKGNPYGGSASLHVYHCPPGYILVSGKKCIPLPPPPPICKNGYKPSGNHCVPIPPPPPKCKKGDELSGYNCVPIPPPPPKCKNGYQLSGYNCVPPPPPPPKCKSGWKSNGKTCVKNPPPPPPPITKVFNRCIKTVVIGKKVVLYGQKGCGVIYIR